MDFRLNNENFSKIYFQRNNRRKSEVAENNKEIQNQQPHEQNNRKSVASNKRVILNDFLDKYENLQFNKKTESFKDVFKEFSQNVPDRTTTLAEKDLAISYINRLLECNDITPDLKNYWTEKKAVIESEMQAIKNEQGFGNSQTYDKLQAELNAYVDNYNTNYPKEFTSIEARVELNLAYNNTCISYYEKMMNSADATQEQKEYCQTQINYHKRDMNYHLIDLMRANKEQNKKTESFNDVFREFRHNVPDRTTTLAEKDLAISYINRLLECDDITPDLKNYWTEKKTVIESEMQAIKNEQ